MRDEECVIMRRNKKVLSGVNKNDRNGNINLNRLSWSISDLSQLPIVRTNSIVKGKYQRTRNASISSCSLSSGSSNFSLRSNGSFRRKARIPVSGFTERAFLANESRMINDAEIIVKEDLEYLAKIDNQNEQKVNSDSNEVSMSINSAKSSEIDLNKERTDEKPEFGHPSSNEKSENCDLSPSPSIVAETDRPKVAETENIFEHENMPSNTNFSENSNRRPTTSLNMRKSEHIRDRGMSVSSIVSRDSLNSISSFSSSFMIDRIFHWRKSQSRSMKSSDLDRARSFRISEFETENCIISSNNNRDQFQQIDKIAAESLASFNSVNEDDNKDFLPEDCNKNGLLPSNVLKVPDKPVKFHIKQLEMLLSGMISPPQALDTLTVQLRLDSLKVLQSLDKINKISAVCDNVYDVPRYL